MIIKTKICPICGNEIPSKENICRYCLKDIGESEFLSKNHGFYKYKLTKLNPITAEKEIKIPKTNKKYNNVLPIRRWLLLMIFTLGFYKYYWFYKNSKLMGQSHPILRTIGFIIPIVNWVMYYKLLKEMQKTIRSVGIKSFGIASNFILYFFVPIFGFWSMLNVQENMNEYWRHVQGLNERRNTTTGEKTAIIILTIIYIIILISIFHFFSLIF